MGLTVTDFSAWYGQRKKPEQPVLNHLSFRLPDHSLTAVVGANGSGKSTLLKGLCRLIPSSGQWLLETDRCGLSSQPSHRLTENPPDCGENACVLSSQPAHRLTENQPDCGENTCCLSSQPAHRLARYISYIPQRSGISVSLPVLDVVMMGFHPTLRLLESPGSTHRRRALQALSSVGLSGLEEHDFLTLSEGQKQLCILARTLVRDTPLLMLDEPDSALDFSNRHLLLHTLKQIVYDKQKTGLIILHDLNLALDLCDQILLLKDGVFCSVLHPASDSEASLSASLSQVCGPVQVFRRNGHCFLCRC